MKRFFANAMTVIVIYVVGSAITVIFLMLKCAGKIKIANPKNLPRLRPRMIIVSNHPDTFDCMYEIFLVPALFLNQAILHPLKYAPWFTPDRRNFTDKWYWKWLKVRAIPIVRGGKANNGFHEAREMISALREYNGVMIYFIEPGRTCTGKEFLLSDSGQRKIRKPKDTLGLLVSKIPGVTVFPIWVDNGDAPLQQGKPLFSWPNFKRGPATAKLGKVIEFPESLETMSFSEITDIVAKNLLKLADKE